MDFAWLSVGAALLKDDDSGEVIECNPKFRELVAGANVSSSAWQALGVDPFRDSFKDISVHGGSKWLHVRSQTVDKGVFLEVSDITSQREADERAMTFLELSFDGFWDWRIKEDYEYMSPRFWEMFGYAPEEKQHKPSEWQAIVFNEDMPLLLEALNKHVASRGEYPFRSECRYRHKNGETVLVACNGRVIEWDKDGSPLRMLGTHTDITELRYRQRIATEHRINEFLAHKVRNPLTSAVQATQFLQAAIAGWPDDSDRKAKAYEDIVLVHDDLMTISSILGRLAELNKIHSGGISFSFSLAAIEKDVLEPVVKILQEMLANANSSHVKVELECQPHLYANIDAQRLKQAMFGILEGSVHRVGDGYIRLLAGSLTENLSELCIAIETSGQEVQMQDDLLTGGTSDGVQNTEGLDPGFFSAKALVEGMGGRFHVDKTFKSRLKDKPGLRIEFVLPGLVDEAPSKGEGEDSKTEEKIGDVVVDDFYIGGRCLVIDDDKIVNKLMTRRLTQLIPNCTIDVALTGEEGIEMAKKEQYRLVIVDHYMPGPGMPLNGAETICQLRLQGITSAIVGCSANDVSAIHLGAGADSFIQKPAQPNSRFIQVLNAAVPRSVTTTTKNGHQDA
jgi:PAS domain S-box-containing protein